MPTGGPRRADLGMVMLHPVLIFAEKLLFRVPSKRRLAAETLESKSSVSIVGRPSSLAVIDFLADSYCPDNGGMLRLCTFGTGTAPPPSGEVAEQFVPAKLKPIAFPVSRAPEISAACMA